MHKSVCWHFVESKGPQWTPSSPMLWPPEGQEVIRNWLPSKGFRAPVVGKTLGRWPWSAPSWRRRPSPGTSCRWNWLKIETLKSWSPSTLARPTMYELTFTFKENLVILQIYRLRLGVNKCVGWVEYSAELCPATKNHAFESCQRRNHERYSWQDG